MSVSHSLSETTIRQHTSEESFRRGCEYYSEGAVLAVTQRGSRLFAEVQGSSDEPYQVLVTPERADLENAVCSCPYDWGGLCKHIVAVLLTYIHQPDGVKKRPPIDEVLAGLSRDQLQCLLLQLVQEQPALAELIEELAPGLKHHQ